MGTPISWGRENFSSVLMGVPDLALMGVPDLADLFCSILMGVPDLAGTKDAGHFDGCPRFIFMGVPDLLDEDQHEHGE